ncbi:MAG: M23 family metallopeptidase [Rikenellaceae bacterium]
MNIFQKIASLWSDIFRRRRLSIFNTRGNRESWYTHISLFNIVMVIVSAMILIFVLTLTLVGYTNALALFPKYRSESLRQRMVIVDNLVRMDSMEQMIKEMMLYSDNVALIMNGKTPRIYENLTSDSVTLVKTSLHTNAVDSTLRAQMEGEGRYNLQLASFGAEGYMSAPADGVITRQFNIAEGRYGVEIAASAGRVMAVKRGVVSMAMWSPESEYTVQIIHPDNSISIYHNIQNAIVRRGDSVKVGEVIGDNNDESGEARMESRPIVFEMWSEGKPIDPEKYIIF